MKITRARPIPAQSVISAATIAWSTDWAIRLTIIPRVIATSTALTITRVTRICSPVRLLKPARPINAVRYDSMRPASSRFTSDSRLNSYSDRLLLQPVVIVYCGLVYLVQINSWWGRLESNQLPSGYEPPALTDELRPRTSAIIAYSYLLGYNDVKRS